jgi:hypothetical protein
MDASKICGRKLAHYYQQQIGVLQWAVELGRVNICAEVSMLESYTEAPKVGHFNTMRHKFVYLQHNPRSKFIFDDGYPEIEATHEEYWSTMRRFCYQLLIIQLKVDWL